MHFREREKIVQLIRTSYDPESKKGKNEVVGKLLKSNLKITPELEKALTDKERKEVKAWVEGYGGTDRLKKELAVRMLPEQMALAEEWFKNQKKSDDNTVFATTVMLSWARLRSTMKKSGMIE